MPDLVEFRKANESIGLRISEGHLSLLSRKLFNVMIHHAQKLKEPGLNAPIDSETAKSYFWIPMAEVAKDAAFDSNDTALLRQHLEQFMDMKIHLEDARQWTSERLVSSIKFVKPNGFKKHGGAVYLGYAFPPEVHQMVMQPSRYTTLSFYYQGLMRTGSGLALYEICRRYATNPSRLTGVESCEWWQGAMNGTPVKGEFTTPYKYFKRDTLKPAIAEINAITDIEISLIEHKQGRRITQLQFHVDLKKQPSFDFPSPPVIDSALIARVAAVGFKELEAADLTAQYSEDRVKACLDALTKRMADTSATALTQPPAYFRWLLKNGPETSAKPPAMEQAKSSAPREGPSLMQRFLTARGDEAFAQVKAMSPTEIDELLYRFKEDPQSKNVNFAKGIDSAMTKSLLGRWYAHELWGEPSAEDLSRFIEQSGNLNIIEMDQSD